MTFSVIGEGRDGEVIDGVGSEVGEEVGKGGVVGGRDEVEGEIFTAE